MRPHITDEIIDAIIQNEGRHVERPRGQAFLTRRWEVPAEPADLPGRRTRPVPEDAEFPRFP